MLVRWALIKADAVDQVLKAGIVTESIKVRMNFEPLQNVGVFFIPLLEPGKCLFVLVKA